jgi:hypothetical protein
MFVPKSPAEKYDDLGPAHTDALFPSRRRRPYLIVALNSGHADLVLYPHSFGRVIKIGRNASRHASIDQTDQKVELCDLHPSTLSTDHQLIN